MQMLLNNGYVRGTLVGLRQFFAQAVDRLTELSFGDNEAYTPPSLAELVEQSRREWLGAKAYYEEVTDPDLVDHAAYAIQAAEKKYIFLLKRARAEGIRLPEYHQYIGRIH